MIILAMDTSAFAASAAVLRDGKIISECYVNCGMTHSQTIMRLVDSALSQSGTAFSAVDCLAVSCGPGSFTGVRIGVSALKGLCFASDMPCYGISTLEAMAYCAAVDNYLLCPVMDARCSQVYTALFRHENGELLRLTDDTPLTLSELSALLYEKNENVLLTGDGTKIAYNFLKENNGKIFRFPEIFELQRASGVAIAAYNRYNNGEEPSDSSKITPVYLRLSQAERELKNRSCKK